MDDFEWVLLLLLLCIVVVRTVVHHSSLSLLIGDVACVSFAGVLQFTRFVELFVVTSTHGMKQFVECSRVECGIDVKVTQARVF